MIASYPSSLRVAPVCIKGISYVYVRCAGVVRCQREDVAGALVQITHIAVGLFEHFWERKLPDSLEFKTRRGVKSSACVGGGVPEHDHLMGGKQGCACGGSESLEPHSKSPAGASVGGLATRATWPCTSFTIERESCLVGAREAKNTMAVHSAEWTTK